MTKLKLTKSEVIIIKHLISFYEQRRRQMSPTSRAIMDDPEFQELKDKVKKAYNQQSDEEME